MSRKNANLDGKRYESTGQAAERLDVCSATLRIWAKDGKIAFIMTPGGKFRFDVDGFLAQRQSAGGQAEGQAVVGDQADYPTTDHPASSHRPPDKR